MEDPWKALIQIAIVIAVALTIGILGRSDFRMKNMENPGKTLIQIAIVTTIALSGVIVGILGVILDG